MILVGIEKNSYQLCLLYKLKVVAVCAIIEPATQCHLVRMQGIGCHKEGRSSSKKYVVHFYKVAVALGISLPLMR